jgi:hypothetical protein
LNCSLPLQPRSLRCRACLGAEASSSITYSIGHTLNIMMCCALQMTLLSAMLAQGICCVCWGCSCSCSCKSAKLAVAQPELRLQLQPCGCMLQQLLLRLTSHCGASQMGTCLQETA